MKNSAILLTAALMLSGCGVSLQSDNVATLDSPIPSDLAMVDLAATATVADPVTVGGSTDGSPATADPTAEAATADDTSDDELAFVLSGLPLGIQAGSAAATTDNVEAQLTFTVDTDLLNGNGNGNGKAKGQIAEPDPAAPPKPRKGGPKKPPVDEAPTPTPHITVGDPTPTPAPPQPTATPMPDHDHADPTATPSDHDHTPTPTRPPLVIGDVQAIPSNFEIEPWYVSEAPLGAHESGNMRTDCEVSHFANDDPLVKPGQPGASHLHMFFGNTEADAFSTYESLRTNGGGTCLGGPVNRSSYWLPAMIDGNDEVVLPDRITVYYKTKPEVDGNVHDFPPGFGMIGGNPVKNGWGKNSARWTCPAVGEWRETIPSCPVGDDVKLTVFFPNCWDGERLWSTDRSHIVYPESGNAGCPASHPYIMPTVSYQIFWPSDGDTDHWRLSADDEAAVAEDRNGSTAHADWFGAWDPDVQHTFYRECLVEERDCSWGRIGDGRRLVGESAPRGGTLEIPEYDSSTGHSHH